MEVAEAAKETRVVEHLPGCQQSQIQFPLLVAHPLLLKPSTFLIQQLHLPVSPRLLVDIELRDECMDKVIQPRTQLQLPLVHQLLARLRELVKPLLVIQ